jgi:hypothetical protein
LVWGTHKENNLNTELKSIGEVTFEGFVEIMGGISYWGDPIISWAEMPEEMREGWENAAKRLLTFAVETDVFTSPNYKI